MLFNRRCVFVLFLICLAGRSSADILERIFPRSVICWVRKGGCNIPDDGKEHGSLEFGREILQDVRKGFDKIGSTVTAVGSHIGLKSFKSKNTEGLDSNHTDSEDAAQFKFKIRAIYPGTKWCGDGDKAESFDDLGQFSDSDSCCREHDNCKTIIKAGASGFNLTNTGLFTRSHCTCDRKFYECLKKAQSLISRSIGMTYFSVLGPQCFAEDYPLVSCLQKKYGRCIEYEMDTTARKIYEWFDNPTYN